MRRLGALTAVAAALAATATSARAEDPACTVAVAQMTIEDDQAIVDAIRATGAVREDEDVFDVFEISTLFCHDLTGDGRPEMAAFLTCCTAASPTPFFIFRPKRYGWKLVYASTRLLVSSEKRKGKKILLRHPVYKRTDPLCCPSSYTRYVVSYSRGQFTRKKL